MASSKGAFWERQILNYELGGTAFAVTTPATFYYALFTTMPAADGTGGVEVSGSNYSRAAYTNNGANWPAAGGSNPASKSNTNTISWPTPSGSGWGSVLGVGAYDASTSGNLWRLGTFASSTSIPNGATVQIVAGALTISEV